MALPNGSGFVVSGVGSLSRARIRLADEATGRDIPGPLEIISVAGSVSPDGAHLHIAIADARGQVLGGHVCVGCEVRTTAELLVAGLADHELAREFDELTGFDELVVRPVRGPADRT